MADRMRGLFWSAGDAGSGGAGSALAKSADGAKAESSRVDGNALVQVHDLVVQFPVSSSGFRRQLIVPVDHVSFHVRKGEVLSVVGESGSGKTTVARALIRVLRPESGRLVFDGKDVTRVRGEALKRYRRHVQMVFQDPYGSLNPVQTVEQHLMLPLRLHRRPGDPPLSRQLDEMLQVVGLTPIEETRRKYPHELSGGQRQRVAIARALAVHPDLLIADEPISMLDVSIRAEILELLNQFKRTLGLSYLYITHDLASARYFGDRIMVMYGGRVMEEAAAGEVVENPLHPYTRLLLAATPGSGVTGGLPETSSRPPNLLSDRAGCPFADRCPLVADDCRRDVPELRRLGDGHYVACHFA